MHIYSISCCCVCCDVRSEKRERGFRIFSPARVEEARGHGRWASPSPHYTPFMKLTYSDIRFPPAVKHLPWVRFPVGAVLLVFFSSSSTPVIAWSMETLGLISARTSNLHGCVILAINESTFFLLLSSFLSSIHLRLEILICLT